MDEKLDIVIGFSIYLKIKEFLGIDHQEKLKIPFFLRGPTWLY